MEFPVVYIAVFPIPSNGFSCRYKHNSESSTSTCPFSVYSERHSWGQKTWHFMRPRFRVFSAPQKWTNASTKQFITPGKEERPASFTTSIFCFGHKFRPNSCFFSQDFWNSMWWQTPDTSSKVLFRCIRQMFPTWKSPPNRIFHPFILSPQSKYRNESWVIARFPPWRIEEQPSVQKILLFLCFFCSQVACTFAHTAMLH